MTAVAPLRPSGPDSVTVAALAVRLLPLLDPCARMTGLGRGTRAWQDAAALILVLSEAEMYVLTDALVDHVGQLAFDVTEALLGVLRASIHPRSGSPTIREGAYRCLVSWARVVRRQPADR
jgi:hypothetical protein